MPWLRLNLWVGLGSGDIAGERLGPESIVGAIRDVLILTRLGQGIYNEIELKLEISLVWGVN